MKSLEKWPTYFRVTKISESLCGDVFVVYLVVGAVNAKQLAVVIKEINLQIDDFNVGEDQYVLGGLVTRSQLEEFYGTFKPRAFSWRGQYYALANAIVDACEEVLV